MEEGFRLVGACFACGGTDTLLAKGAWFGVGDNNVAVGLHVCGACGILDSALFVVALVLLSGSGRGLRRCSSRGGCVL